MAKFDALRNGLILDTGALFCALIFNYTRSTTLADQKRTHLLNNTIPPEYRWRPRFDQEYLAALSQRQPLVTTAHVIAELQGLTKGSEETKGRAKLYGPDLSIFWEESIKFIEQNITEDVMLFQEVCRDQHLRASLLEIGPTDTIMIAVALQRRMPIVTIDGRTLAKHAKAFAVACLFPEDLLG